MKEVVIAGYLRTAQSRSRPNDPGRDWFCKMRADELVARLLPELIQRTGIDPEEVDDFILGCATGVGEQWAYGREGLRAAMRDHNNGLQYWLYTLVVHRYLQTWLPGYRYDDHFGGILYLFVRGMHPDKPGSGVFFERPAESGIAILTLLAGIPIYMIFRRSRRT